MDEYSKDFPNSIDRVLAGTYPYGELVPIGKTPPIIEAVGFRPLIMAMGQKHVINVLRPVSESTPSNHTHGLSREYLNSLPKHIAAPAMIFDSLSHAADSIVLVTTEVDCMNRPIVIAMKEGHGMINGEDGVRNIATSTYGRNGFNSFLNHCLVEGKLLFWDKKKSLDLLDTVGLQLPKALISRDSDIIIRQARANVNTFSQNKNENLVKFEEKRERFRDFKANFVKTRDAPTPHSKLNNDKNKPKGK